MRELPMWWLFLLSACLSRPPKAVCTPGSAHEAGTPAFRAADWGLAELGVTGTLIVAVDFDNDGWTDLFVRKNGNADDFSEGGVRTSWLLRNTGDGRFEDVTLTSAIRTPRTGGELGRPGHVAAFGDVDNDGDLDVYTGLPDPTGTFTETSELMLNDGAGGFSLAESGEIRRDSFDVPAGAAFADVDRDGELDLWVVHSSTAEPQQDRLYIGDGEGGFREVTTEAGLTTERWVSTEDLNAGIAHTNAWSALACDLNDDGSPEILASSYGRSPNHLWQNDGSGGFVGRGVASGYAFDGNQDWTDNESARCWCTLHPDDVDCAGVPAPENIRCEQDSDAFRWTHTRDREVWRLGGNSGGTSCGDVDNDGHMDLLTSEIVHWDVGGSSDGSELLFNTGESDVRFERPGNEATGLTREHDRVDWNDGDITNSLFDFDNDGRLDVYIGSTDYPGARGLLFHNQGERRFAAVPPADGIDHMRSHGSAVADFDRDGDLDIVVGHSPGRCDSDCYATFEVRFFENLVGQDGNWVQLRLEGVAANRAAIGARLEFRTPDGGLQVREVDGGHGHYGQQDDLVVHVGLGDQCEAEVTVRWPDTALTEETARVTSGWRFHWVQGEKPAVDPRWVEPAGR